MQVRRGLRKESEEILQPREATLSNSLLCLSVPFEEDEKDPSVWFLDHNYVESMNDMFKKVNAREKLVGWYHTGPKLRASDLEINELFKRYTPNPLLVIIDVQPKESGVPTDAYFAVEEIKDVSRSYSSISSKENQADSSLLLYVGWHHHFSNICPHTFDYRGRRG
jgi:26S proteasome regulatory subunit N8